MECFVEGSVDDDVRVCHAGLSVNGNDEVWYHSFMCDSYLMSPSIIQVNA